MSTQRRVPPNASIPHLLVSIGGGDRVAPPVPCGAKKGPRPVAKKTAVQRLPARRIDRYIPAEQRLETAGVHRFGPETTPKGLFFPHSPLNDPTSSDDL